MSDVKTQEHAAGDGRQRLRLQGQQPKRVLCQGWYGIFDCGGRRDRFVCL